MNRNRAILWSTALLALACALLPRPPAGAGQCRRPRVTEIKSPSGQRLVGFFDGMPAEPRYDLREIGKRNTPGRVPGCGGRSRPDVWDRLFGLLGPTTVDAANGCTRARAAHTTGRAKQRPASRLIAPASINSLIILRDRTTTTMATRPRAAPHVQCHKATLGSVAVTLSCVMPAHRVPMITIQTAAVLGTSAMGVAVQPNQYARLAPYLPLVSLAIPIRNAVVPTSAWRIAVQSAGARRVTAANTPVLTDTAKKQAPSLST